MNRAVACSLAALFAPLFVAGTASAQAPGLGDEVTSGASPSARAPKYLIETSLPICEGDVPDASDAGGGLVWQERTEWSSLSHPGTETMLELFDAGAQAEEVAPMRFGEVGELYGASYSRCGEVVVPEADRGWAGYVLLEGRPGHRNAYRVLAHLNGGVVQHTRPAQVTAEVRVAIGHPPPTEPPSGGSYIWVPGQRRIVDGQEVWVRGHWRRGRGETVTLALQVLVDGRWEDLATRQFAAPTRYREAQLSIAAPEVPELHEVRLEVRTTSRRPGRRPLRMGGAEMFRIFDAEILVEHCQPDPSSPGNCL